MRPSTTPIKTLALIPAVLYERITSCPVNATSAHAPLSFRSRFDAFDSHRHVNPNPDFLPTLSAPGSIPHDRLRLASGRSVCTPAADGTDDDRGSSKPVASSREVPRSTATEKKSTSFHHACLWCAHACQSKKKTSSLRYSQHENTAESEPHLSAWKPPLHMSSGCTSIIPEGDPIRVTREY